VLLNPIMCFNVVGYMVVLCIYINNCYFLLMEEVYLFLLINFGLKSAFSDMSTACFQSPFACKIFFLPFHSEPVFINEMCFLNTTNDWSCFLIQLAIIHLLIGELRTLTLILKGM
jgi:hypothetical protein